MEPLELTTWARNMNTYESHIWGEVLQWEQNNKGTLWDYCTTASSKIIQSAIETCTAHSGAVIPQSFTDSLHTAIEKGLKACYSGSKHTLFKSRITDTTFHMPDLEQLDNLASEYASSNEILSALEGAGMGLGGLFFVAADIPTLITLNLRLLNQMAYIYGVDTDNAMEREFILNIMLLACSDKRDRHGLIWTLDQQAKTNEAAAASGEKQPYVDETTNTKLTETAHRIALKLTQAKLLQFLPLVGIAIGAGGNYAFSREIAHHGMMVMRKRWLMRKYRLFDAILRYRETKNETLQTSWVLLPENEEDEDGLEFEEDFKSKSAIIPTPIQQYAPFEPQPILPTTNQPHSNNNNNSFHSLQPVQVLPPTHPNQAMRPPVPVHSLPPHSLSLHHQKNFLLHHQGVFVKAEGSTSVPTPMRSGPRSPYQ